MGGPFRKDDDPRVEAGDEEFRSWLSDRSCPVCGIALYAGRRQGIGLDACGGCGGVWLSSADAQKLLATRDPAMARIASAASLGSEKRAPSTSAERRCPDCGGILRVGSFPPSNVVVDVCNLHGTWFDALELLTMMKHLAPADATIRGPYDRPTQFDTPFVHLVKRLFEGVRNALGKT